MSLSRRTRRPTNDQLVTQFTTARVVIAAGIFAAPTSFVRVLGADSATAARVTWLTRMMAVRDGAIGFGGIVAARRGTGAAPWLLAGAVSDAVDAGVLLSAVRSGRLGGAATRITVPLAAGAAVVGVAVAAQLRRG